MKRGGRGGGGGSELLKTSALVCGEHLRHQLQIGEKPQETGIFVGRRKPAWAALRPTRPTALLLPPG